jgi:putative ABC transport system permease protein
MGEKLNDKRIAAPSHVKIAKQIVLPWTKAIEISAKSIKVRFWRSMITMSSIVLAIAFLASILTSTTVVGALRDASVDKSVDPRERDLIRVKLQTEGAEVEEGKAAVAESKRGFLYKLNQRLTARDKWLVALALLVCFVGIVNAMLMSVTERFREIGTMKCLGALDSFIVKLFLLEASFQGVVGTMLGIILGTVLSIIRSMWAYSPYYTFKFFPVGGMLMSALLALAAGTVLSVIAALFPARAAARMQPVEALRSEQ